MFADKYRLHRVAVLAGDKGFCFCQMSYVTRVPTMFETLKVRVAGHEGYLVVHVCNKYSLCYHVACRYVWIKVQMEDNIIIVNDKM